MKLFLFKILAYICTFFKTEKAFGFLAAKMADEELKIIERKCKTIIITGSCGKTTTLCQTVAAIKASGAKVVYLQGAADFGKITAHIFKKFPLSGKENMFAVFETESENLAEITSAIKPYVIAVTNIYKDKKPETDIFGNIEKGCIHLENTIFVLNGDEPALNGFMKEKARRYFYGFRVNPGFTDINISDGKVCPDCNNEYKYIYNTHAHLGNYSCDVCGKTRPQLALGVGNVLMNDESGTSVSFDGLQITIPLPGGGNVYNALCAATIAGAVGVEPDYIKSGIENLKSIPAVCEKVRVNTKEVCLMAADGVLECTQVINSILPDNSPVYIACMLGGNSTDWIYEAPFEKLINLNYHGILVGGDQYKKMLERLEGAGLDTNKFTICEDMDTFIYSVRTNVIGKLYVIASKKAMKEIRRELYKKKFIKSL